MRVGFLLLDVFAETPLTGNQLCVVPDGEDVPPELMQPLANEVGLSETTFVVQHEPTRYRMRIFTPARELPFAGHPSLGTAFCLRSLRYIEPRVTQVVEAGEYLLEVDLA